MFVSKSRTTKAGSARNFRMAWMLCLVMPGMVADFERLGLLFQLFATVLHHLNSTGSAAAENPGIASNSRAVY